LAKKKVSDEQRPVGQIRVRKNVGEGRKNNIGKTGF